MIMKTISLCLLLALLLGACSTPKGPNQQLICNDQLSNPITTEDFDFDAFVIGKKHLGPIKIGMQLAEAEKHLCGLERIDALIYYFGFGGPNNLAYLYYLEDEPFLCLFPSEDTTTITHLFAIHPQLRTTNGLSPKASANELLEKYPDAEVGMDLMNTWEHVVDSTNQWCFTFLTDQGETVGEYPDLMNSQFSEPINGHIRAAWIML